MSSKKTLKASEQEREDMAKSRDGWQAFQKTVDARRLIFPDESGLKTNMTRLHQEGLAPPLRPGDIVVMDNLSAHKSRDALDAIRERQAEVLFLPAYSPGFNPIEKMWSKVKQILRGIKPRAEEELFAATATALNAVSADDAQGWFGSCGYTAFQR